MTLVVKSEGKFDCLFRSSESVCFDRCVLLEKLWKTSKLFEFILDILSEPRYRSVISWDGTDGEFVIRQPKQVALMWGERNGRPNMTYQKFSRAMRYYYHKKVLTKIRGRKFAYKFNFQELEMQYGYYRNEPYRGSNKHTSNYAISASCDGCQYPIIHSNFPATMAFAGDSSYNIPAASDGYQYPITHNNFPATMELPGDSSYKITASFDGCQYPITLNNFPATMEFAGDGRYEIPATHHGFQHSNTDCRFPATEI